MQFRVLNLSQNSPVHDLTEHLWHVRKYKSDPRRPTSQLAGLKGSTASVPDNRGNLPRSYGVYVLPVGDTRVTYKVVGQRF